MSSGGIPANRLSIPTIIKNFNTGIKNGINVSWNNLNKILNISVVYNPTNLKIDLDGKLNTKIDLENINTNEIKVITDVDLNKDDLYYSDIYPKLVGISKDNYSIGEEATIITLGEAILNQTLLPHTKYFINNLDKTQITANIPSSEYLVYVGKSLDTHTLLIEKSLIVKLD